MGIPLPDSHKNEEALEAEYLPPGHPITHDIELDFDRLKTRLDRGELMIREGRLHMPNKNEGRG